MWGHQTQDSQEAPLSYQAVLVAVVSHHSSRALALPVPAAMPEVTWALAVLGYPREAPTARGSPSRRGAGVAVLAASSSQSEPNRWGKGPEAAGAVGSAHTQERPQHLTVMQGSTVMRQRHAETLAPEAPEEFIAHVRGCGGAGWVTTGSTRKPTPTAFAPASLRLLARLTAGVRVCRDKPARCERVQVSDSEG